MPNSTATPAAARIADRSCHGPAVNGLRRALVLGSAGACMAPLASCGGGAGSAMGSRGRSPEAAPPAQGPTVERELPLLALDEGLVDASGTRRFRLRPQRGTAQLRSGSHTPTWGYNGGVLGPALRLRRGEPTAIEVHNDLAEPTSVHWHGLIVPAEVDGGPHQPIPAGGAWEARFTVVNPASTCWYHPHLHGATGRQVVLGLAGLLIVDHPALDGQRLPDSWGVDDVALVFQDKRFTATGQIDYTLNATDLQWGYRGDHLLVNGALAPVWRAPRQWVRLRLLNGCNARTLQLRLSNALPMLQIANEGGLLAVPVPQTSITLGAGERAEVLVDLGDAAFDQDTILIAGTLDGGMGIGVGMGMGMGMGRVSADQEFSALRLRASRPRQPGAMLTPPDRLPAAPEVRPEPGAPVRTFTLGGGMMDPAFTINGRRFDRDRIDFAVPAGTVEIWRLANATGMAHPMHVHGVHLSLLPGNAVPLQAHERGLRDTFVVPPMQTVDIAVQTPALASPVPLMVHCHILEHEDAGMMGQFVTI